MVTVRLSPSGQPLAGGGGIPAGSYVGQPVGWDGSAFVPLDPLGSLVFNELQSQPGVQLSLASDSQILVFSEGSIEIDSGDLASGSTLSLNGGAGTFISSGAGLAITATDFVTLTTSGQIVIEEETETSSIQLDASALNCNSPQIQLTTASDQIKLSPLDVPGVQVSTTALGFYDKVPIARPIITGVLPQDQIDSIVAALVALGLVTDGR